MLFLISIWSKIILRVFNSLVCFLNKKINHLHNLMIKFSLYLYVKYYKFIRLYISSKNSRAILNQTGFFGIFLSFFWVYMNSIQLILVFFLVTLGMSINLGFILSHSATDTLKEVTLSSLRRTFTTIKRINVFTKTVWLFR